MAADGSYLNSPEKSLDYQLCTWAEELASYTEHWKAAY